MNNLDFDIYLDGPDSGHFNMNNSPMPQPPEGATHALWSESLAKWHFWRVIGSRYRYFWPNRGEDNWRPHKRQVDAQLKLARQLKEGTALYLPDYEPEPEQHEEGSCTMNLENAALLVRDDIRTVKCEFPDKHNTYTYVLHNSIPAKVGDELIVYTNNTVATVEIVSIDPEVNIDPNSSTKYKWALANLTNLKDAIAPEIEATDTIARALKQRQAANVREQILQQFGVSSHTELMALGQDNSQGE